jgi:hypothetical protein
MHMKKIVLALIASLMLPATALAQAGCSVIGGWPGAQYGQQYQLLTDALPCYGITGTKGDPVVLGTLPHLQGLISQGAINVGVTGINANSANTDTPITVTLPNGYTKYRINGVFSYNPSTSLTNATAGVFTAAGGTGTTVVTNVALSSLTNNTAGTSGSFFAHGVVNVNATFFNSPTLYYRIGTAQGSAATVDVTIQIVPLL